MIDLTGPQRDAVLSIERHILVTAGAGSGKTSTVVARVLHLLGLPVGGPDGSLLPPIASPVAFDRIAAITFTNAAAADLKDKLRKALLAAGRRDLAWEVDAVRIGTIHSFCGDLLREMSLRGGRDAALDVLDEGQSVALAGEVARDTLLDAASAQDIEGLELLLADHGISQVESWVTALIGDADRLRRYRLNATGEDEALERTLLALAERASLGLGERLRRLGATSFDRLITDTRDLLHDHADVRAAVQGRLFTLIVDEFQDVDPAQRELVYSIADPTGQRPDSPRLMLVGDPKQSIYRFRRADVTVWESVRQDFVDRGLGRVIELTDNFRSTPEVLALVDTGIGPLLDELEDPELGRQPFEVPHLSLAQGRDLVNKYPPKCTPGVELLVYAPDEGAKKVLAGDRRDAEAEVIAARLERLRLEHPTLSWRDVAILSESRKGFDAIEAALRRRRIPAYQRTTDGYFDRREVQDLILGLEVVRDPRDDRAFLGWLRSPFCGLRDESLLALARVARRPLWDTLTTASVLSGEEGALLKRALDTLNWALARRDRVPLDRLVETILVRTGWLAHLGARGAEGEQAIANTRKFLRFVRRRADLTVGGFLRLLSEERAAKVKVGDERLHGPQDDVVTITTAHASKGLEWAFVAWTDLGKQPIYESGKLVRGRTRLALGDPQLDPKHQPPRWQQLRNEERQEEAAEQKRLWYVAATRARDAILLGGLTDESKKGSAAEAFGRTLGFVGKDSVTLHLRDAGDWKATIIRQRVGDVAPGELPLPPLDAAGLPLLPLPLRVSLGRPRHSATSFLGFGRCERRHRFKYRLGIKEPPVGQGARGGMVDPITRGSIVHDVLEQYAEEAELEGLLEAAIGRRDAGAPAPETPLGERYRLHLREEVLRIAQHPEYRAIAETEGAVRELSFVQILPGGAFTEGAMDLAAPGPNGLVLLDVKTSQGDMADCESKAKSYAPQRDVYVAAAGALSGEPVERFAFQFSRAAVQVSESVGAGGTAEAQTKVIETARRIAADADGLAKDPRECRYCGFKEAGWCPGAK